ncbi:hypothetical protein CBS101457_001126 [Exobasidium rhododendri]|nr:hypothetical protein CBS101457_001126 [Exobasidium rhododendri]
MSLEEAPARTTSSSTPQVNAAALRKRMEGQNRGGGGSGSNSAQDRRNQGERGARAGGRGERGGRGRGSNFRGRDARGSREGYEASSRARGGASGRGRDGNQRSGQRGGRGGRGGGGSFGSRVPVRSEGREWDPASSGAAIQSITTTTNWRRAINSAAQGVARVPYTIPTSTLESLRKGVQTAKYRPLKEARKNLMLHKVFGKEGTSMGPSHDPSPIARPRRREDDAPVPIRSTEDGSVAEEAKKARVQYMQEKFGGDYVRWETDALNKATSIRKSIGPVDGHAVVALTLNDDLGPTTKVWALDTVKKIASGVR